MKGSAIVWVVITGTFCVETLIDSEDLSMGPDNTCPILILE